MSKLVYLENNPRFHVAGALGVTTTGLLALLFAGWLGRPLWIISPLPAKFGALASSVKTVNLSVAGSNDAAALLSPGKPACQKFRINWRKARAG
jgi:hypothetical protein